MWVRRPVDALPKEVSRPYRNSKTMKIHEYQARQLFEEFGIPVMPGQVAATAGEALAAAERIGYPVVLKAQVHSGGRGKAGGVKIAANQAQADEYARRILALRIQDMPVGRLLVTRAVRIARETYLSLLIDRDARTVAFIGCAEGGVDIEQVGLAAPEKIIRLPVSAGEKSIDKQRCLGLSARLFESEACAESAAEIMVRMAEMLWRLDCSLIEINPLAVTDDGRVVALDAKVLFDDNALFRHPELLALRDMDLEDRDELEARESGLSFIRLDGQIGCMVNGAGLAMAVMDTIKHFGGRPANFLDVGGSSSPDKIVAAFEMILRDPGVKVIFVNIFGGITRCDDVAAGILEARRRFDVNVPIVIRLAGTNEQQARRMLADSDMIVAGTLEEGAERAVALGASR